MLSYIDIINQTHVKKEREPTFDLSAHLGSRIARIHKQVKAVHALPGVNSTFPVADGFGLNLRDLSEPNNRSTSCHMMFFILLYSSCFLLC